VAVLIIWVMLVPYIQSFPVVSLFLYRDQKNFPLLSPNL
jgi:hypothetical protein